MSIFFSYIFFIAIIFLLARFVFPRNEFVKVLQISFVALIAFSVFGVIVYWSYHNNNEHFLFPDQYYFFIEADRFGKMNDLSEVYNICFTEYKYHELPGTMSLMSTIAYTANNLFDGNSVFLQMAHIVFLSSLIPMFVYSILRNFATVDSAARAAYVWIFCSHLLFLSPWIMRDIHITLLYAVGLAIMFSKFNVWRLVLLMLLIPIIGTLRFENGIFALFMPVLYLYEHCRKSQLAKVSYFILGLLVLVVVGSYLMETLTSIIKNMDNYTTRSLSLAEGLGVHILRLPFGVRHLVQLIYSTIFPFPSWYLVKNAITLPQYIIAIVHIISPIFWFIVCVTVVRAMFVKSLFSKIPYILKLAGLVFIVYILAVSSELNVRRMICMYPILYAFYVIVKDNSSKKWFVYTRRYVLAIYALLAVLYTYLII